MLRISRPQTTNSREQSPSWEANRSSARQEISQIIWNPKVPRGAYMYHRALEVWVNISVMIWLYQLYMPLSWRIILCTAKVIGSGGKWTLCELSDITVFRGKSGENHRHFNKYGRWLGKWNIGDHQEAVIYARERGRGRSSTDGLRSARRTVALPNPPVAKPAHSSALCERPLPDLRFSQRCWCRYKYCVDWLTLMDVTKERTASKFKVSSERRQYLNTDLYPSESSVQNQRYTGPWDSDVKPWPVLKDPSIYSHFLLPFETTKCLKAYRWSAHRARRSITRNAIEDPVCIHRCWRSIEECSVQTEANTVRGDRVRPSVT